MSAYDYNDNPYKNSYADGGGGGGGGGGFLSNSGFSQGGGDGQGSQAKRTANTLRPVTIKQINEADQPHPDADFKIDGEPIGHVSLVGVIRNIAKQATNTSYSVEDGTGSVDVRQWLGPETQADSDHLEIGQYVRIVGTMKSFNTKRHVSIQKIQAIKDFNQVTYHLLEATYVHLYFKKGPLGAGGDVHMQNNDVGGGAYNAQADTYGGAEGDTAGLAPIHRDTIRAIQAGAANHSEGVNIHTVKVQGYTAEAVQGAIEWLMQEGMLYTTLDDDHVKSSI